MLIVTVGNAIFFCLDFASINSWRYNQIQSLSGLLIRLMLVLIFDRRFKNVSLHEAEKIVQALVPH